MKPIHTDSFKAPEPAVDIYRMSWLSRPRRLLAVLTASSVLYLCAGISFAGAAAGPSGEAGSGPRGPAAPAALSTAALSFTDLTSKDMWAKIAIQRVAQDRLWMRDFGDTKFRPSLDESRILFARTLVRAYGNPDQAIDPHVSFNDLSESDALFAFANIAVANGWMRAGDGDFRPEQAVTLQEVYRGLVMTLPLSEEINGLDNIHDANGYHFDHPGSFPTTELGMRLYFRYNHGSTSGTEAQDIEPDAPMPRAEVAWALFKRMSVSSGQLSALKIYRNITLPALEPPQRKVVEFGLRYVGYPYIWGGEWYKANGAQPTGGFDCSGLMWWLTKAPGDGYDNTKIRGYQGWSLPQRTSATMAAAGKSLKYGAIKPGDLMFYDGTGDGIVDHVDLNIGNGWSLDSSSSVGGVTILRNGEGWYRDHFKHARHFTS